MFCLDKAELPFVELNPSPRSRDPGLDWLGMKDDHFLACYWSAADILAPYWLPVSDTAPAVQLRPGLRARLGLQTGFSEPLQTWTGGPGPELARPGTSMGVHSQHKDGQDLNIGIKH